MKRNEFETSQEKFTHLWKMPPHIESITNLDPRDVGTEHLEVLDWHLESLQWAFPEIANEIQETREKISAVMWLKFNISWEVMQAANNPAYRRQYRKVS